MGHRDIQLMQMTPEEVEGILLDAVMLECRGNPCAASDLVPGVVAKSSLETYRAGQDWFWCAPRLFCDASLRSIVGSGCFKGSPVEGQVEIGYGVAETEEGKGYATAGVACMVEEAFSHGGVGAVIAETSIHNPASQRVLEKNGFRQIGERQDPEDGPLIRWQRDRIVLLPDAV